MDKKIAFITGGCKGIGAAVSIKLKSLGYKIISTSFSYSEETQDFANKHDINIVRWDVANKDVAQNNTKKIIGEYGVPSVIVHNAGITNDSFFHKMTSENWFDVINTNLISAHSVINPFISHMREQKFGRIIVLSSVNALKGQMGQTNYSASKAGLIGFIKALAQENASKNITANAVAPGYTETNMTKNIAPEILEKIKRQIPVGRMAQPEEIAHAVAFLCDDMSGYITGETLNINGGLYFS